MVLDGSEDAERRSSNMLFWDVLNGVTRRAWSRNENAEETIKLAMKHEPKLRVTVPQNVGLDDAFLKSVVNHK